MAFKPDTNALYDKLRLSGPDAGEEFSPISIPVTLEPEILEKLDERQRRLWRKRVAAWSVIAVGAVVLLFVGPLVVSMLIDGVAKGLLLACGYLLLLTFFFGAIILSVKGIYREYIDRRTSYHPDLRIEAFENGLEAVSIAAGITAPRACIFEEPGLGVITFSESKGGIAVGLSPELLKANISAQEAEALMAHEIGHVVISDTFKPPGLFDVSRLWLGLPAIIATAFLIAGLFLLNPSIANESAKTPVLVLSILPFLFIVVVLVGFEIGRDVQTDTPEMDLLADTIACRLTSDPDHLVKAVEKLDRLRLATHIVTRREDMKRGDSIFRMSFTPTGIIFFLGGKGLSWIFNRDYTPVVMLESREMITQRLRNLEDIKRGHSTAFERVTDAKIKTEPEAWK